MKEAVRDAVNRTTEKYEADRTQLTGEGNQVQDVRRLTNMTED